MTPQLQQFIKTVNSGSGSPLFIGLRDYAVIKFGQRYDKWEANMTSWMPCNDIYANSLISKLVGITTASYGSIGMRIFLRTMIITELGSYLTTGNKTEGFLKQWLELDYYFWSECSGKPTRHRKLLTN